MIRTPKGRVGAKCGAKLWRQVRTGFSRGKRGARVGAEIMRKNST